MSSSTEIAAHTIEAACKQIEKDWRELGFRIWEWRRHSHRTVYYVISTTPGIFKNTASVIIGPIFSTSGK